ncbi:hypothetical protein RFI_21033, partial [Reticulomyxa filosa]
LFKLNQPNLLGIRVECTHIHIWNAMVDLIAYSIFKDSFWDKRKCFRVQMPSTARMPSHYWETALPQRSELANERIRVTFKKLVTISKTLLKKNPHKHVMKSMENVTLCFCDECITDRQVPLRFKLQFFDDQLDSNPPLPQQLSSNNHKTTRNTRKKLLVKNLQNKRKNQQKKVSSQLSKLQLSKTRCTQKCSLM